MTEGPLAAYRARLAAGSLKPDPFQALAAEKLQSLHHAVARYQPSQGRSGWRERLGLARRRDEPPQGLYIFGRVGRGKSMLMDLFFDTALVERKRRVHFHAFMQEVHESLHRWRQLPPAERGEDDPIPPLARRIAEASWLLCFDEFQVTDIADAMILGRLFTALFELGVVVVATSNTAPDDLYKDGLQRELFLPFIALLKEKLDILELNGEEDYRRGRLSRMTVYYHPLGPEAEARLEAAFADLTDGARVAPCVLHVKGRRVAVPLAGAGVARFSFTELCEQPLGAADYLAIATHFHTVALSGIPRLAPHQRNAARRLITLVDALYEHRVKLVCTADAPPDALYPAGEGADAFGRTASRLFEMQTREYLALPHLT